MRNQKTVLFGVFYFASVLLGFLFFAPSNSKDTTSLSSQPNKQLPEVNSAPNTKTALNSETVDSREKLEIQIPSMPDPDLIDFIPEDKLPRETNGPQIIPGEFVFLSNPAANEPLTDSSETIKKLRKSVEESTRDFSVSFQDIRISKREAPKIGDGLEEVRPSLLPPTYDIKINGLDAEATLNVLHNLKADLGNSVIPNYVLSLRDAAPAVLPNLQQVNVPGAQTLTQGTGVVVAVLDTGIYPYHSNMVDRVIPGFNTYDNNTNTQDQNGHGTGVAGIIAGKYTGIALQAKILAVKVTNDSGSGTFNSILNGIDYAYRRGANIVNLSAGGSLGPKNNPDAINAFSQWNQLLNRYKNGGMVLVGAAPNSGDNRDSQYDFPSSFSQFISVGAVDSQNRKANFSSFGSDIFLFAPGVNITILQTTNGTSDAYYNPYRTDSGTSFSTPHVTGAITLISSLTNYVSDIDTVKRLLAQNATSVSRTLLNNGTGLSRVLNVERTVRSLFADPRGACGAQGQKCCSYGLSCRAAGLICSDQTNVPYPGRISSIAFSEFTCKRPPPSPAPVGLGHSCGYFGSAPCSQGLRCANSFGLSQTIGVARPPFMCQ